MATTDDVIPTYYMSEGDRLDFQIDHAAWLGDDTISTAAWSVSPTGPTLEDDAADDTTTTIWVDDVTLHSRYLVTVLITTAAGRLKERSFWIEVRQE
jgi:hypothetical protein